MRPPSHCLSDLQNSLFRDLPALSNADRVASPSEKVGRGGPFEARTPSRWGLHLRAERIVFAGAVALSPGGLTSADPHTKFRTLPQK